jgi:uncharacterized protein DUF4190
MPISVTCQCGARLEIDEKFLGKEIPCPDCQRPLPTQASAKPPPLDLPNYRRKSGLAVMSLAIALVFGWVPVIGAMAALVCGIFALRQIAKHPNRLDGAGYARAGIVVAAVALLLTPAALISPMFVLYTDQFIRELKTAGKVTYSTDDPDLFKNDLLNDEVKLKRFPGWAKWTPQGGGGGNSPTDLLFLVNTADDAYVTCFNLDDVNVDAPEEKHKKVVDGVYKTQLVHYLGELRHRQLKEGTLVDSKKLLKDGRIQELVVDIKLARLERRLLIHYPANGKHTFKVLVGACRHSDFERMQETFRKIFESMQPPLQ